jgi:cobalt-zinc-cadmium efflux system outer membrane protein
MKVSDRLLFMMIVLIVIISKGCSNNQTSVPSVSRTRNSGLAGRVMSDESQVDDRNRYQETVQSSIIDPNGVVTLEQAVSLALLHNPKLEVYSWDVRAAQARRIQAGLRPNPEIGIEMENFGGTGSTSAFETSETTIQVGQLIELSGKRAKREHLADIEKNLVKWDYLSKQSDVYAEVTKAFFEVLAAQENFSMQEKIVTVCEQMLDAVTTRVDAGKDPPLEITKAQVELFTSRIERRKAVERLQSARRQLSAQWGQKEARFEKAAGNFESISSLPTKEQAIEMMAQNPDIARLDDEIEARRAALALEKANSVPDPSLSGGLRHLEEENSDAFVVNLEIPLPVNDRNQGSILEAVHELAKARANSKAVRTEKQSFLLQAYEQIDAASDEVKTLQSQVLPGAQNAFDTAQEGYRVGKFDYLTILDAQRTLFDIHAQYIESLLSYHMVRIELERLIKQPPNPIPTMRD